MSFTKLTRRGLIQAGAVAGAGLALPTYLRAEAHASRVALDRFDSSRML